MSVLAPVTLSFKNAKGETETVVFSPEARRPDGIDYVYRGANPGNLKTWTKIGTNLRFPSKTSPVFRSGAKLVVPCVEVIPAPPGGSSTIGRSGFITQTYTNLSPDFATEDQKVNAWLLGCAMITNEIFGKEPAALARLAV